jgi:hypothetical protein
VKKKTYGTRKSEKDLRGANKGKEKSPSKKEEMTSNLRNEEKERNN